MPKSLIDRCRPDSIVEFRLAARQRYRDGTSLAVNGRRTAAIYLWGYTAEMTLKAAYFARMGFGPTQAITTADLRGAKANAVTLGFTWTDNLHNLESWSLLLAATRIANPAWAYLDPTFGGLVMARGRELQRHWDVVLRYHKNVAYIFEVERVQCLAEWFLLHSSQL